MTVFDSPFIVISPSFVSFFRKPFRLGTQARLAILGSLESQFQYRGKYLWESGRGLRVLSYDELDKTASYCQRVQTERMNHDIRDNHKR